MLQTHSVFPHRYHEVVAQAHDMPPTTKSSSNFPRETYHSGIDAIFNAEVKPNNPKETLESTQVKSFLLQILAPTIFSESKPCELLDYSPHTLCDTPQKQQVTITGFDALFPLSLSLRISDSTASAASPSLQSTELAKQPTLQRINYTGKVLAMYYKGAMFYNLPNSVTTLNYSVQQENLRKANVNLIRIQNLPKSESVAFNAKFLHLTGINFLEFLALIYTSPHSSLVDFSKQSVTPDTVDTFVNTQLVMDNSGKSLTQKFNYQDPENYVTVTTTVMGTKTFASNALNIAPDVFTTGQNHAPNSSYNVSGINYNLRETVVLHKKFAAQNIETKMFSASSYQTISCYQMYTTGSYKTPRSIGSVVNAEQLLQPLITDAKILQQNLLQTKSRSIALPCNPIFILDFRVLNRIPEAEGAISDISVFDNHAATMNQAATNLGVRYLPIWGNSLDKKGQTPPPSNMDFVSEAIPWLQEQITAYNNAHLLPLLHELESLIINPDQTANLDIYQSRSHFIKIFTLTRILIANFPENFILIGGCMSAKDRVQSLVYASEILIHLYHIKGNLDFIDKEGRLDRSKLDYNDIIFLKMYINNLIGQTFLSEMGIGHLNNKRLVVLAEIFKNVPELNAAFSQVALIKTSSANTLRAKL